jgi:hypothetical protein
MKKLLIACTICLSVYHTQAQQSSFMKGAKEKIEGAHIAFISTRLNLDEATSKNFWPIYNKYAEELKAINTEKKQYALTIKNDATADAELDKAMNGFLASQSKALELQKRYKTEFLKVINIRQLAKLYATERDFKEKLLRRMGERAGRGEEGPEDQDGEKPRRRFGR